MRRLTAIPRDNYNSDIPARRLSRAQVRPWHLFLSIMLVLAVLSGPTGAVISVLSRGDNLSKSDLPQQVQGLDVATQVAEEYLAGLATKAPVTKGVDPDLGRANLSDSNLPSKPLVTLNKIYAGVTFPAPIGTRVVEQHRWRVVTQEGVFELTVPVEIVSTDVGARAVLFAAPSMSPAQDVDSGAVDALDYTTATQDQRNRSEVTRKVSQWVTAYVSGTPADLADVAGTVDDRNFKPLSGQFAVQPDSVKIISVTAITETYDVARVVFRVTKGEFRGDLSFDLLLKDVAAAPKVVGWGPPGTGIGLSDLSLPTSTEK